MKKKSKKDKKESKISSIPEDSIEMGQEFITTVTQLQTFISKMPKCYTISSRLNATKNLLSIKNNELYQKCIELKGLSILSKWLKEYKTSVQDGTDLTRDEEFIVNNIIHLCDRIHLSINDLKISKIGKSINSLGKVLPESCSVKKHCEDIVSKWRKMIESNEEAKEDNFHSSPNQQNNYDGDENGLDGINNNDNQFLNAKTKRNSHSSNTFSNSNNNSHSNNLNTNVNNTCNKINSIIIKTAPKKSCLKKGNSKKGLNVHFNDLNLTEVKIFKSTDEPSAPNISQEEYMKIQEEIRKNPHKFKIEEIRKKEVTMDISQQKEPEIAWKLPPKLKLEQEIENDFKEHGKDSLETKYIEDLCACELKIHYFQDIPEPTECEKKLFSFTDESIPKIENSQVATKTNDVTIDDVSKFWDNLGNNITKENLKQFEDLLAKVVDIDSKAKQQILEQAKIKYEQENMNNQNYLTGNNNNININNNLTINNNQRILSMNNYPNLMNLNNLNQISGATLPLLNNMKQLQPHLETINYLNQGIQNQNNFKIQQPNNQNLNNNLATTLQNINPMLNLPNYNFLGFDFNQINNFQQQQLQNNNNKNKSNLDQRMIMESAQRMNVAKYKTKPCRNYHSSIGCTRGDNCFFIHDPNFKGREIQNFDPRNYERNFPLQLPGLMPQAMGIPNIPNLNPQIGNQFNQMGQMGMDALNLGLNLQQMMELAGNLNQNRNKNEENEQFGQNNMINGGIPQNNMENIGLNGIGVDMNNNGFVNRQIMEQGINLPGYNFNFGVGLPGQNMNQNNNAMM